MTTISYVTISYFGENFASDIMSSITSLLWHNWREIAVVWFLLEIMSFFWSSSKKVVIINAWEDYASAEKGKEKEPGKTDSKAQASRSIDLAGLLALKLTRIDEIYQAVDEKRPIQSASGVGEPIEAAIKAERVGDDISLGESDIRLGPIIVPMKSISTLMSHILRGSKIIIGLHEIDAAQISVRESRYFLTAVMTGKMRSYSWVVDSPESIEEDSEGKDKKRTVEDMVTEMAHRISSSLKEESTGQRINWKAMWDYNEGLRAYRDGLSSARQHKYFLSIAERKFIDASNSNATSVWLIITSVWFMPNSIRSMPQNPAFRKL